MGPSGAGSRCVAVTLTDFGILGREMSEEPTTPDLLELARRIGEATGKRDLEWEDGKIARITNYTDVDEARAAAERLAQEGNSFGSGA